MSLDTVRSLPYNHPYRWDGTPVGGRKLWTPSEISVDFWVDAHDEGTITESSGSVSQWDNKGSTGDDLVQSSGSNQPAMISDALGGYPVIRFNGSSDYLLGGNVGSSIGDMTFMVLMEWNTLTSLDSVLHTDSWAAGGLHVPYTGDNELRWAQFGSTDRDSNADISTGTPILHEVRSSGSGVGSSLDFWADGASNIAYSDSTLSTKNLTDFTVGGWYTGSSYTRFLDADIAEMIIISSAVTTTVRQQLEGYLLHKWGLESNLPSGHPYVDDPPFV
jgi:hypothetical protein